MLRIAGHVSSAKETDGLSNSNSFLQVSWILRLRKLSGAVQAWDSKPEDTVNIFSRIHTCHHRLGLPILHHEKQHTLDLNKQNQLALSNWYFRQWTSKQETHNRMTEPTKKKKQKTNVWNEPEIVIKKPKLTTELCKEVFNKLQNVRRE